MTNTGRLISIKAIADILMQNPVMRDLNFEFIVSHAVECMRLIGAPAIYISKTETIEIKDYKGSIPMDLMQIISVNKIEGNRFIPMRVGMDSLHNHYDVFSNAPEKEVGQHTYTMNNSRVFTNFEDGKVNLTYRAIATDSECYPLVLDSTPLVRAIRSYIKYKWFDILNDLDQISDRKLNKAEQDYAFNVGQAQSSLQMPNEAEMESLVNSITQILPSRQQFNQRFEFLGSQEYLRIQ